jgi:DNA replication protein DnaC
MATQLLLETQLKQLRLPSFLENYQSLAAEAARNNLPYERYLLGLAQEEVGRRERNTIERSIRQAHFPVLKELSDFDFTAVPTLAQPRILDLAQGGYMVGAEPIIMVGNPGLGKSHLATGLALTACRQGQRVRFYNAAGLVNELMAAQQDYRLSRFMAASLKMHLIVLDELGFIPFSGSGAQLLFQFISNLYERVAVIVTTNLRFAEWSSVLGGDERLAAALLDRLTHRAHILEFVGTSFRFREQLSRENLKAGPGPGTADREGEEEGEGGETSQSSSTETPLSKEKEA